MTLADKWDPKQYERFKAEREQPFFDLLSLVRPKKAMRVVDLGCGTGELTRTLHDRLSARETVGIDSSEAMLEKSRAFVTPGLRFEKADLRAFSAVRSFDLVFSNAALHWVPDHPSLLRSLEDALDEGGQLAVQVPANQRHPSQVAAEEVAEEPPFKGAMLPRPKTPVLPPEEYSTLLHKLGFRAQHVRLQIYPHLLASRDEVVEWMKGALLTDFQKRMPAALFPSFLERYRERLLPQLEDSRPYLFPFRRIIMWAER
ncbi:MAG: methyltransferase domain-containing protein [Myxococcaceae bacterium]